MRLITVPKTVGHALFSLGLVARQASAVDNCIDLIADVDRVTSGVFSVENDFSCSSQVVIDVGQLITLIGPATISIGAGFSSDSFSLFANEGSLTLQDISFVSEVEEGNRAIWNTGTLSVEGCSFQGLRGTGEFPTVLEQGGAIYSVSSATVDIIDSTFASNLVSFRGGAIFAGGSEKLTITGSTFQANEADSNGGDEAGAGGDLWAAEDVELTVTNSVFSGSSTEYGGASIECCGGEFRNSSFTNTESSLDTEHFGAVLVGRPGVGCPRGLEMSDCTFDGCTVNNAAGAGGSLAIFDASADLESCVFESNSGTALLFESSSAGGDHKLSLRSCEFNENREPSELYASDTVQGSAIVITNTGVEEGDEPVSMGEYFNIFCYGNTPYECELVEDLAEMVYNGDFKCQVCDMDGVRQPTGGEEDLIGLADRDADDSGSDSWDTRDFIIVGLSGAVALSVIVGSAILVWLQCKKKERPAEASDPGQPPTSTDPPLTTTDINAPAPVAPTTTTGAIQPTSQS